MSSSLPQSGNGLIDSVVWLRSVVNNVIDGIVTIDHAGRIITFNPAAERIFGYTAPEVLGRNVNMLMPEPYHSEHDRYLADYLRTGHAKIIGIGREVEGKRKDGSTFPLDLAVNGFRIGEQQYFTASLRDITELKRAQEELSYRSGLAELAAEIGTFFAQGGDLDSILQNSAESLVRHLHAAFARIWILNESAGILELRASAGLYTHRTGPHSRIPLGHFKIGRIAHERRPHLTNSVIGDPQVNDQEWARREGMESFAGYPLISDGRVAGVMAMFSRVPISEAAMLTMASVAHVLAMGIQRLLIEETLKKSEELFRGAFEYTNLATAITDLSNRFIRTNAAFARMFGYSEAEILTLSVVDITHPDDMAEGFARRRELLSGENNSFEMEKRYVCRNGNVIWGLVNVSLLRNARGDPEYYIGQLQDITERKRAEEGLKLRDRAIQAVSEGILITDANQPDDPIIYASPGFERLTGYTAADAMGHNCRILQGPGTDRSEVEKMRNAIRSGQTVASELLNYRKDGSSFWNAVSISPIRDERDRITHFVGVQADVTARRNLEMQFRQAQKLEAVGSLAGGVAHDFNNLLTIITGYSDLIQSQLPPNDPLRDLVHEIGQAGARAAGLTRQLLAFSRKQVLQPQVLNLNTIVLGIAKMLTRLIGENIDLATSLAPNLGLVKADPGQIEQVLINLVVNARDAMPEGGKLTIETANLELDETYTQAFPDLRPGLYVRLAVSDTGIGMDEVTKSRIFEPFFTTKEEGKGTGLGLATVFGIVKQSDGHVAVYSEPGQGAIFKVYLPKIDAATPSGDSRSTPHSVPRGKETILLVEDEAALLALSRHVLRSSGYTVLDAIDGESAIRIAERYEGPIDLLITDVVMPGLSGRKVADAITRLRPELKVLFVSGYTDDAVVRHGILEKQTPFLQKPFGPNALAQKARAVLDQT